MADTCPHLQVSFLFNTPYDTTAQIIFVHSVPGDSINDRYDKVFYDMLLSKLEVDTRTGQTDLFLC